MRRVSFSLNYSIGFASRTSYSCSYNNDSVGWKPRNFFSLWMNRVPTINLGIKQIQWNWKEWKEKHTGYYTCRNYSTGQMTIRTYIIKEVARFISMVPAYDLQKIKCLYPQVRGLQNRGGNKDIIFVRASQIESFLN